MSSCPSRSIGVYATHGAASESTPSNCMTDRTLPPRAQNPDVQSRGTGDNSVRLRHVEPARMPLQHAVPSPPQLPDSLHRLAKEQSRWRPDFLSGHVDEDGEGEHRGDFTQEADLVRRICSAHGGYDTANVRDVRRIGGGRGLRGGQENEWMVVWFLDDLRAFGINADKWITVAQDEKKWHRMVEQGAERFMAKLITAEKIRLGLQQHAVVYPNVTERTKERTDQSKRACAGSLVIVD